MAAEAGMKLAPADDEAADDGADEATATKRRRSGRRRKRADGRAKSAERSDAAAKPTATTAARSDVARDGGDATTGRWLSRAMTLETWSFDVRLHSRTDWLDDLQLIVTETHTWLVNAASLRNGEINLGGSHLRISERAEA